MERSVGQWYIGEGLDGDGNRSGDPLLLASADLTTHGVIVGMTGSGKTGLGIVTLEEALLSGVPVLAIDPKGDLGNLALTFPALEPADFEPWIDPGAARVANRSVAELAAETAAEWRDGLASWGLGPDEVARLRETAEVTIYTPGSTNGVPLDVLGRLSAPDTTDPNVRQDELDGIVTGLLGLVGVESDPLSGREHILLVNLLARLWDAGQPADLATVLAQLLDPPIRKLGVMDLDTFFPPDDRRKLATQLNGLLASASFSTWATGEPLDIGSMLWTAEGAPRAAVVAISHLSDAERQFAVTLVLSKLVSWMRSQPGTGQLRVLVYVDEVMGLAPPVGNPPAKKPILTLLKQARAFGVGLVLATQNPVDLDYKAISNAGTWLIGRLQTEQDKNRLVDGLRSADGLTDVGAVGDTISGLGKRQFVHRSTSTAALPLLGSRWAMSYLAGPLTGDQISRLMAGRPGTTGAGDPVVATGPGAAPPSVAEGPPTTEAPATDTPAGDGTPMADDESPVPPEAPDGTAVRYVTAAAPWLGAVGGVPGGARLVPALATRVEMTFDDTKADLRHQQEWEAVIPLGGDRIDLGAAISVDYDERDLSDIAPEGAVYVLPGTKLTASALRSAGSEIRAEVTSTQTLTLLHNPDLKLWSRPGETAEAFAARCAEAAEDAADAETAGIRDKLEKKLDSLNQAVASAQDRVDELEARSSANRQHQIIDIGASVLGSLLGGRSRTRGLAAAARRMSSGQRRSATGDASLETARRRVADKVDQVDQVEADLAEAVIEIDQEWSDKATNVESVEIPLEKADVTVDELLLIWIPTDR
ncbi:MAG: helicase HerA domain-containing protein [Acidimicrobiales bacterium]